MTENSTQTENYLKAIWNAAEWSTQPVTVSVLAARLGLAASSVSEAVRKLTARGLVTHAPYSAIALSAEGERIAVAMVRKHRVIETFLVEELGYAWDEVHDEAEVLEHRLDGGALGDAEHPDLPVGATRQRHASGHHVEAVAERRGRPVDGVGIVAHEDRLRDGAEIDLGEVAESRRSLG